MILPMAGSWSCRRFIALRWRRPVQQGVPCPGYRCCCRLWSSRLLLVADVRDIPVLVAFGGAHCYFIIQAFAQTGFGHWRAQGNIVLAPVNLFIADNAKA